MIDQPIPTRPFYASPDKTYEEQRKCRLQDAVDDYLQDEKVTPKQIYSELIECVNDVFNYHQTNANRANDLKSLIMGNREVDLNLDDVLTGIKQSGGFDWTPQSSKSRWHLSVEKLFGSDDYFIKLPEDLLDKVGWETGDDLEWIDNFDGSFTIRKQKKLNSEEQSTNG